MANPSFSAILSERIENVKERKCELEEMPFHSQAFSPGEERYGTFLQISCGFRKNLKNMNIL
jgi:hypothetical protein